MNELFRTIGEIQTALYDNYKVAMTTYYKTWIEPFFSAWCKDFVVQKECGCKCKS